MRLALTVIARVVILLAIGGVKAGTTITDTITDASGRPVSGSVTFTPVGPFQGQSGWVSRGSVSARIKSDGTFTVTLEPTDTATANGQYYTVAFQPASISASAVALVPTSETALHLADVIVTKPVPGLSVVLSQISTAGSSASQVVCAPSGSAGAAAWCNQTGEGGGGLVNRGTWSSGTAYSVQDIVQRSGSSYVAILSGTNHAPESSPTYWSVLASQGAQGVKGDTGDTGAQGTPGTNGNTVLNGTGAPSSGTGVNGDYYLRNDTSCLYGPKSAGSWGSCVSLIGPQGPGGGGGSGSPGYYSSLITNTTATIAGSTHGFTATPCDLNVKVWDTSTPRKLLAPDGESTPGAGDYITVDPTSCDVVVRFNASTSFYVSIDGGAGPQGDDGQSVTATAESNGANCTYGGWKFVSVSGTSYVCNGAPGTNGNAGSNGTSFVWRGAYGSGTAYVANDVVSYSGSAYISILAGTNHQPDTSPTYWTLMASRGSDGPGGGDMQSATYDPAGKAAQLLADPGSNGLLKRTAAGTTEIATSADMPSGVTATIASGNGYALSTSSIAANTCVSGSSITATGAATTDIVSWSPSNDWTALTGYGPASSDGLLPILWVSATNTISVKLCNLTGSTIASPGAATINWAVRR